MPRPCGPAQLPAGLAPRGLTRAQAATYCGIGIASFDDWVRRGLIPGSMTGTKRWDRVALDRALDKLSGITASSPAGGTAYDDWKATQAAEGL